MENTQQPPKMDGMAGLRAVVGVVGGVGAYVLMQFFFAYALIPVGAAFLAYFLFLAASPTTNRPILPAAAIQIGYAMWLLVPCLLMPGNPAAVLVAAEGILLLFAAIWLGVQPNFIVVAVLSVYQIVMLLVNGSRLTGGGPPAVGGMPREEIIKALTVHILLRFSALASMAIGMFELSQAKEESEKEDFAKAIPSGNPYAPPSWSPHAPPTGNPFAEPVTAPVSGATPMRPLNFAVADDKPPEEDTGVTFVVDERRPPNKT